MRRAAGSVITGAHVISSKRSLCLALLALVSWMLLVSPARPGAQELLRRGQLGVFIQNLPGTQDAAGHAVREGVIILGVMRGSPAERGGLQRGDILLKFNGQPLRQVEDLQRLVSELPLGETVDLEVLRRDHLLQLPVQIEAAPMSPPVGDLPGALPLLLERDAFLWIVLGGAALSLILVYLSSARPWRHWRLARATAVLHRASRLRLSRHRVMLTGMGLALFLGLWSGLTLIGAGQRGVVFHLIRGVRSQPLDEGIHFLLPVLNRVTIYDMRSRTYDVRHRGPAEPRGGAASRGESQDQLLWTPTADGLKVGLALTVRYRLDPSRLVDLHRSVGPEYEGKIVHPIVWNVTRLVASEYSLLDIYGKRRHEMQQQVLSRVQAMFARDGLIAEDLLLRDVVYTKEFEKTLVAKMIAEQKVQESEFEVRQAELRAQAGVIEAQGEARALELVNDAIREQPLILQYLWIKSLPERLKVIVVPSRSGTPTPTILADPPKRRWTQSEADPGG
jgi:regulator of protease activity HflC (stomatin/prohibitin superfamily)